MSKPTGPRPARSKTAKPPPHYQPKQPGRLATLRRRRGVNVALLVVGLPLAAVILWQLRLLFRPLIMLVLVRYPALLWLPLLAGTFVAATHLLVRLAADRRDKRTRARDTLFRGPRGSAAVAATLALIFAAIMVGPWAQAALYQHTDYGPLDLSELTSAQVRIKPYRVAVQQTRNGLNSPTEHPTNTHIVRVDGRLVWTSVRDPEGLFRVLTKPTRGVMSVDAASSAPGARIAGRRYDAAFRFGPGMRISENIRWQLYKRRCYTCDVAELVGLPTADGPVILAPYLRYEGSWLVRRPVFGGVYVVHPDGRIDDLSPEQAARDPLLRSSGRIFPEKLARKVAEAYELKKGVTNRFFFHEEELHVADTEQNQQPFLQEAVNGATQWVTTLKPRGETFTTAAIMTTDALTGRTRIWRARSGESLIGNERALDIVRGETFPGIVFAPVNAEIRSGRFGVVEPRQVFRRGRLLFLCSIVPDGGSRIARSVLVDAKSQLLVGNFPATPAGDADLIAFLRGGSATGDGVTRPGEGGAETTPGGEARSQGSPPAEVSPPAQTTPAAGEAVVVTLRRLLAQNRVEQRRGAKRASALVLEERDLVRLLRSAQRSARSGGG